jgi:hypothetical protein
MTPGIVYRASGSSGVETYLSGPKTPIQRCSAIFNALLKVVRRGDAAGLQAPVKGVGNG